MIRGTKTSGVLLLHFQASSGTLCTKVGHPRAQSDSVKPPADVVILGSGFNPAAEEFRSFDQDPPTGLISSLTLDNDEEPRRGASRANSVRFDEKAINHHGQSSRSSGEILPIRTGSGFGSHPMSERSLSHRSDGRGSSSGLSMRANSFGIEGSRFFNSTTSSPLHAVGPPPGLFILGPVPSIIRCWLTSNFSNDSLLYAAVCSGSHVSSLSRSLVSHLQLQDQIVDEGGAQWLKLAMFLPEGTIQTASSRSNSPAPQVPALSVRFDVYEADPQDASIQIIIGSDVLRAHNADILFSQDKVSILDDERNRIAVPLVRPENENVYKNLNTRSSISVPDTISADSPTDRTSTQQDPAEQSSLGVIGRPTLVARQDASTTLLTPSRDHTASEPNAGRKDHSSGETTEGTEGSGSLDTATSRTSDERSAGDESSLTTPTRPDAGGVWNSDWRRTPISKLEASVSNSASGYAKAVRSGRGMKILKPTKSMANSTRAASATVPSSTSENPPPQATDARRASQATLIDSTASSKPRSANPVGEASAFSWMSKSMPKRAATGGD